MGLSASSTIMLEVVRALAQRYGVPFNEGILAPSPSRRSRAKFPTQATDMFIMGQPASKLDMLLFAHSEAQRLEMDHDFVSAVIDLENPEWDPSAVSPTGAVGLGQITKVAYQEYLDAGNAPVSTLKRWDDNLRVTVWYLKWVAKTLGYSDLRILSAEDRAWIYAGYNIGVGSVRKLRKGVVDGSLRRLVSLQARKLSSNGVEGYFDSVKSQFA